MTKEINDLQDLFDNMKEHIDNLSKLRNSIFGTIEETEKILEYDKSFLYWLIGIPATSFVLFLSNIEIFIIDNHIYSKWIFVSIIFVSVLVLVYYGLFFVLYHSNVMNRKLTIHSFKGSSNSFETDYQNLLENYESFMDEIANLDGSNADEFQKNVDDNTSKLEELTNGHIEVLNTIKTNTDRANKIYRVYRDTKYISFIPLVLVMVYIILYVIQSL